jgi:phosphohistidine phosphatase SixA
MNLEQRMIRGLAWAVIASLPAVPLGARAQTHAEQTSAAPAPTKITPAVPNAALSSIPLGADPMLIADLKAGGYIILLRHAMTNWNERDGTEGDFSNRAKQRNLSAAGQLQASAIGKAIMVLSIPIEKVLASPMWRCRDTAEFAFGAYDTTSLLFWKGPKFREARLQWLSTPPAAGKNLVLVGHQDQFIPIVPGLRRDQLKEGDALVFEPLGKGKFRVVRQIPAADWARLAGIAMPPLGAPVDSTPEEPDTLKASTKQPLH